MFALAPLAEAFDTYGADTTTVYGGSKWGDDPSYGTGAVVTWGFMPDDTPVDPTVGENEGIEGTSQLSQIRDLIDTNNGSGAFEAAIQRAFDSWSAVANITFVGPIEDEGNPVGAVGSSSPMIRIGAFTLPEEFWVNVPGAIGFGPPGFGDQSLFPLSGDVIFALNRPYTITPFQIATGTEDVTPVDVANYGDDIEGLFLHELGHAAIGLEHPRWAGENPDQRVMYVGDWLDESAPVCCQALNQELHVDDIAGAEKVYGIRGDFNRDGRVDAADYTLWRDSYGEEVTRGTDADANVDGVIDLADYASWKTHFGDVQLVGFGEQASFWEGAAAIVPEPSSWLLIVLALVPIATRRARRVRGS